MRAANAERVPFVGASIGGGPVRSSWGQERRFAVRDQEGVLSGSQLARTLDDLPLIGSPQLAKKYHPDVNKEDSAKTRYQEVQDAYDVSLVRLASSSSHC